MKDTIENRAALRMEIRTQRDGLTRLAEMLEGVDHAAARDVEDARSALFAAWSKLRAEPPAGPVCPMIRQAVGENRP